MEIKNIILQFLTEGEEGTRNPLTWFLNMIMEYPGYKLRQAITRKQKTEEHTITVTEKEA